MLHVASLAFFALLLGGAGAVIWNGMKGSRHMILRALGIETPCEIMPLPPRPERRVAMVRIVRRAMPVDQAALRVAA